MIFEGLQVTADGFRLEIATDAWDQSKQNTFDVEPEHFDRGRYVQFVEQRMEGSPPKLELAHWYVADANGTQIG